MENSESKFKVGDAVIWTRDEFTMTRLERSGVISEVWHNGAQFMYRIAWRSTLLPSHLGEISSGGLLAKY